MSSGKQNGNKETARKVNNIYSLFKGLCYIIKYVEDI